MLSLPVPSPEVSAFLPSLEMARRARAPLTARVWWRRRGINLLEREPFRQQRLAAILTVLRTEERGELFRYPYVPSMPFALEEGATRLFERSDTPPECLRVELERESSDSPYRGSSSVADEFHGYAYGNALEQVRRKLTAMRSSFGSSLEVFTYAIPILWLTYRSGWFTRRDLALVVRPDRVLHALLTRT